MGKLSSCVNYMMTNTIHKLWCIFYNKMNRQWENFPPVWTLWWPIICFSYNVIFMTNWIDSGKIFLPCEHYDFITLEQTVGKFSSHVSTSGRITSYFGATPLISYKRSLRSPIPVFTSLVWSEFTRKEHGIYATPNHLMAWWMELTTLGSRIQCLIQKVTFSGL